MQLAPHHRWILYKLTGIKASPLPVPYRLRPTPTFCPYAVDDGKPMHHLDVPTLAEFKTLALARDEASVSIYMPTSAIPADARANRIAFEDLAKEALAQLGELGIAKKRIRKLEEQFARLAGTILENTG